MTKQDLEGTVGGPFNEVFDKYSAEFGKMEYGEYYFTEEKQRVAGVKEPQGEYSCEFRKGGEYDLLECKFGLSKTNGEFVVSKYVWDFETPKEAIDEVMELIRIRDGLKELIRVKDGLKERGYDGEFIKEEGFQVVYTVDFESPEHLDQLLADFTEVFNG